MGASWEPLGVLGASGGPPGGVLGASWGVLAAFSRILRALGAEKAGEQRGKRSRRDAARQKL